ncbi:MAG: Protein YrdA [Myxococcota bacterium]|nr:Protein YrdA [Myxococcota bacterium]
MGKLLPFKGVSPRIHPEATIFDGAVIIGDVEIGAKSSVWFNCVVRGDVNWIKIGERTNIQDLSMLHVTWKTSPLSIGDDVTVGHSVTLHACSIEDRVLVGMGSTILDRAVIGHDSMIAAGSLVTPGTIIPPRSMVMGSPARVKRELTGDEIRSLKEYYANAYLQFVEEYKEGAT